MRNIAPDIFRQRLIMEGLYSIEITKKSLETYLYNLAENLNLRMYSAPIIFSPASGMGKEDNQGFDAFVPLIDSGISAYIWSTKRFLSIVIYTCKGFDEKNAITYTKEFFQIESEMESKSF